MISQFPECFNAVGRLVYPGCPSPNTCDIQPEELHRKGTRQEIYIRAKIEEDELTQWFNSLV